MISLNKEVSEMCFGTWQIGGAKFGQVDIDDALNLLCQSYDKGVNIFETSNVYGNGRAEVLLGLAFPGEKRHKVTILSKAGYLTGIDGCQNYLKEFPKVFDKKNIAYSLDESLRRLRTDYLDIFLLHDPTIEAMKDEDLLLWLEETKCSGKIKTYGVSTSLNKSNLCFGSKFKVVEILYNPYKNQAKYFIDAAEKAEIDIIARSPFHNGEFFKNENFKQYLNTEKQKKTLTIAHQCFDYVLKTTGVKSVSTGMILERELQENITYWN